MAALLIQGMHGLGDNLRQRALLRQMMATNEVWLESSWISVYHDLIAQGLKVVGKPSGLRTQAKNATREATHFVRQRSPMTARPIKVWYPPAEIRRTGSVLAAMCAATGCDIATADFRLPVPPAWIERAQAWLTRWNYDGCKPLLIYRPLVERTEWSGCAARNPDHAAFAALFESILDRFFVISIADLIPGKEWLVGAAGKADAVCHKGELEFETLAALTMMSALMFCSPGFAGVLAQAVETPVVCVFGGYEKSEYFFAGARGAPVLTIDPINPCGCFRHDHACDKRIDLEGARAELGAFAAAAAERATGRVSRGADRLERPAAPLHERGRARGLDRATAHGIPAHGA